MWPRGTVEGTPACTKSPRMNSICDASKVCKNPHLLLLLKGSGRSHIENLSTPKPCMVTNGNIFSPLYESGRPQSAWGCWYPVPFTILVNPIFQLAAKPALTIFGGVSPPTGSTADDPEFPVFFLVFFFPSVPLCYVEGVHIG
jgi:hypothetical protein